MNEKHIRLSEAAEMLGISVQTLRVWNNEGKIYMIRTFGNQRRVPVSEVERVLNQQKQQDKPIVFLEYQGQPVE